MKNVSELEIQYNFDKLISIIEKTFSGDRKEKLLKLFNDISNKFAMTPASGVAYFHLAYPGGLVLHTLNVLFSALKLYNLWSEVGADMSGYTKDELIFCAIVHDLGKIGNLKEDHYIVQDKQWYIENRKEYYKSNPNIQRFEHSHRSIWILNQYEIKMSEQEFIAIMIHDGLYLDSNKSYFVQYAEENVLKTNLSLILHQADFMSYRIEYEQYRSEQNKSVKNSQIKKNQNDEDKIKNLEKNFEDIFTKAK